MPRPRAPRLDPDPALFPAAPAAHRMGRHERQTDRAVRAARSDGSLGATDAALVSMLRALARALDLAERTEQPYAVAQVSRELRAALSDARLTPVSRGIGSDPFGDLLADLTADDTATT